MGEQVLAKTWYPYLFSVLRNLSHKFEKLADVTKSAKKNVTIWAPRKAGAPQKTEQSKQIRPWKCQRTPYINWAFFRRKTRNLERR